MMTYEHLEPRVSKLETKVTEHHERLAKHESIILGVDGCEDTGLVSQVRKIDDVLDQVKDLLSKQTVYNKVMGFVASAIGVSVIGYIMSLIFK